ncbi:MAG: tetratricopeptide repeat protein, partial [Actinomycetota bacterium]
TSRAEGREAANRLAPARAAGERGSHLYYALGRAYLASQDHPAAIRMLNEGIKAHPDVAGLYYTLADVYAASGRPEESRAAREKSARLAAVRDQEEKLLKTIAEQPEQSDRYLPYIDWLIKRRDFETAVAPLRQVLRMDPQNSTARHQLQVVANALKRPELIRENAATRADKPE